MLSVNHLFIQQLLSTFYEAGTMLRYWKAKQTYFCLLYISQIITQIFNYKLKIAMKE